MDSSDSVYDREISTRSKFNFRIRFCEFLYWFWEYDINDCSKWSICVNKVVLYYILIDEIIHSPSSCQNQMTTMTRKPVHFTGNNSSLIYFIARLWQRSCCILWHSTAAADLDSRYQDQIRSDQMDKIWSCQVHWSQPALLKWTCVKTIRNWPMKMRGTTPTVLLLSRTMAFWEMNMHAIRNLGESGKHPQICALQANKFLKTDSACRSYQQQMTAPNKRGSLMVRTITCAGSKPRHQKTK